VYVDLTKYIFLKCICNSLALLYYRQEAQLILTTGSTRFAVSRGQQTWYHFGSIATFR